MANGVINNIGAYYDSACTIPVDLSIDGLSWSISKPQLFETIIDNPNTTQLWFKNLEIFPIYEPHLFIMRDDFQSIFSTRKAKVYLDGGIPDYDIKLTDLHASNGIVKANLLIDIPRSLQKRNGLVILLAYHNITYAPDMPVYRLS